MKTKRATLHLLSLLPGVALLSAACAANTADPSESGNGGEAAPAAGVAMGHIMPMPDGTRHGRAYDGKAGQANFTYRGGPVISNVKVFAVHWNSSVSNQSALGGFYGAITDSAYIDWLSEYDTPTQHIGRGKYIGAYVDSGAPSSSTISDAQIQSELKRLLNNKKIPAPDADTLYMMHFPPGVTISMQGMNSCQQFCAYHSSFRYGSANVYYGVMPDYGPSCNSCGGTSDKFQNTTVVASHEVVEAITDPNIGVANETNDEKQLGWYDDQKGEISDVCEGQSTTFAGYAVTKNYSNQVGACIATKSTSGGTGSGGGGTGGGGTGGGGTGGGGTGGGGTGGGGTGGGGTGSGGGSTCAHALCSAGGALTAACDPCATQICQTDPYCCSTAWDRQCVNEVSSVCNSTCSSGSGGGTTGSTGSTGSGGTTAPACSHGVCLTGGPLLSTCGPCTNAVCQAMPSCCTDGWDATCVSLSVSICGKHCQ
jgi:hypothetical protein